VIPFRETPRPSKRNGQERSDQDRGSSSVADDLLLDGKPAIQLRWRKVMKDAPFKIENPDRYDIATEVLSSAVRILQSVGFDEEEIPRLFEQVATRGGRAPIWLEPLQK
jgi:hypothetical protein